MPLQFFTNMVTQASRKVAGGIFATGLMLIGFGVLIYVMPKLFATLAALVFFAAGLATCMTALKIFSFQYRINRDISHESNEYRKNVRIHDDDDNEDA